MGIPTSQNLDTPEGLKSWLSIEIRRILTELPHLTELKLRKHHRTRTGFGRSSALELLRGRGYLGKRRRVESRVSKFLF
jgi:hypothetical protein